MHCLTADQAGRAGLGLVLTTLAVVFGMRMSEIFKAREPGLARNTAVVLRPFAVVPSMAERFPRPGLCTVATLSRSARDPALLANAPDFTAAPAP